MAKYKVKVEYGWTFGPNKYHVVEVQTKYVLDKFDTIQEAQRYCKFLNKGGAFNGISPQFITCNP